MNAFATITADWTSDKRVRRILATFPAHPPRTETTPPHARWTRDDTVFVGNRVEALQAIRNAYGQRVLDLCERLDDYSAWDRFCASASVQDVVLAALHDTLDPYEQASRLCRVAAGEQARAA